MSIENRKGCVVLQVDFLLELIGKPADTRVLGIYYEPVTNGFRIILEGDDFQVVPPGEIIPQYYPVISMKDGWYSWEWGEPF